jgi:hypothetical protein
MCKLMCKSPQSPVFMRHRDDLEDEDTDDDDEDELTDPREDQDMEEPEEEDLVLITITSS